MGTIPSCLLLTARLPWSAQRQRQRLGPRQPLDESTLAGPRSWFWARPPRTRRHLAGCSHSRDRCLANHPIGSDYAPAPDAQWPYHMFALLPQLPPRSHARVSGRRAHSDRVTPGHHLLQQADQTGHDHINIIQSPGNRESLLAGLEIMHGCVTNSGPRRRSLAIASLEPARLRCTTQLCWQARARNLSMSLDHGLQDNGPRQLAPHQHRRKSMRCRQGGGGGVGKGDRLPAIPPSTVLQDPQLHPSSPCHLLLVRHPPVGLDAGQAKLHVDDTRRKRTALRIVSFLLSILKHSSRIQALDYGSRRPSLNGRRAHCPTAPIESHDRGKRNVYYLH